MANADAIRQHCLSSIVEPARRRGDLVVAIRTGDVASEVNAHAPAVCSALGSDKFEALARIRRLAIDGPIPGLSTLFVFRIDDGA